MCNLHSCYNATNLAEVEVAAPFRRSSQIKLVQPQYLRHFFHHERSVLIDY